MVYYKVGSDVEGQVYIAKFDDAGKNLGIVIINENSNIIGDIFNKLETYKGGRLKR